MKITQFIALLITGFVLFFTDAGYCQTITFGPSAGMGHSYLTPYRQYEYKLSWNAGVSAIYSPDERWGIGLDVKYSSEGRRIAGVERELNYIRVPLRGICFLGSQGNRIRPRFSFGPSVGFLVNTKYVRGYEPNTIDLGVTTSVGFSFRVVKGLWFNMDIKSYQGLTDVYTRIGSDVSTKELNGNVCLDTGLLFGF